MSHEEESVRARRRRNDPNPNHRMLSVRSYRGCDYCDNDSKKRRAERLRHPYCELCILEVRGYQAMVQRKPVSAMDRLLLTRFALDEAVYALYNSNGHTDTLDAMTYPDEYAATIEHDSIRARYADNPNVAQAFIDFTQDDVLRTQLTQRFCIQPLPSYYIISNVFHYIAHYHYNDYKPHDIRTLSVASWKPILKALLLKYFDFCQPWKLGQLSAPDDTPNVYHGTGPTSEMMDIIPFVDQHPHGGLYCMVPCACRGRNAQPESEWEEYVRHALL